MHRSQNPPSKNKTFNSEIRSLASEAVRLVISKQFDYGKDNILKCPLDPKLGVLIRLNDKLSRLGNLLSENKNPQNESIRDTWADIVGYGLIGLMLQDKTFTLPLKDSKKA